jgi:hypothetical protein
MNADFQDKRPNWNFNLFLEIFICENLRPIFYWDSIEEERESTRLSIPVACRDGPLVE